MMMTSRQNRKARRAAERAARRLETSVSEPRASVSCDNEPTPEATEPIPARLAANRANAQLSTGPTSEAGKAKSSKNALKTALTGRTVLLPTDDAGRYEHHLAEYRKAYQPAGERELELVQSLADTTWRLDRIPGLEEAIYVKGANEFADQFSELDPRERNNMLRMHTYLAYERQLRNLNLQEMRLHRLREKLIAEIRQLQREREQKQRDLSLAAHPDIEPFDVREYMRTGRLVPVVRSKNESTGRLVPVVRESENRLTGFEFSTQDVEALQHEKIMSRRGECLLSPAF